MTYADDVCMSCQITDMEKDGMKISQSELDYRAKYGCSCAVDDALAFALSVTL